MIRLHNSSIVDFIINIITVNHIKHTKIYIYWNAVRRIEASIVDLTSLLLLLLLLINYESMVENWFFAAVRQHQNANYIHAHLYSYISTYTRRTIGKGKSPTNRIQLKNDAWNSRLFAITTICWLVKRIASNILDCIFILSSVLRFLCAFVHVCVCMCAYAPVYSENWHDIIAIQLIQPSTKAFRCRMFSLACSEIDLIQIAMCLYYYTRSKLKHSLAYDGQYLVST